MNSRSTISSLFDCMKLNEEQKIIASKIFIFFHSSLMEMNVLPPLAIPTTQLGEKINIYCSFWLLKMSLKLFTDH